MKKLISIIICLAMSICMLAGCDEETQSKKEKKSEDNETTQSQSQDKEKEPGKKEPVEKNFTDEEIIDKSKEAFSDIKSVSVVAEVETDVSVMGQTVTTKGDVVTDVDVENSIQYANVSMTQNGTTTVSETYVKADGNQVETYVSSNGIWMKQTQGIDLSKAKELGIDPSSTNVMVELYLDNLKNNSTKTEETVDGKECYVFEASINSSQIEMLKQSSLKDTINALMQAGISEEELEEMLSSMGNIEYKISIDKETFLPVRMDMEMSEAMTVLMGALLETQGVNMKVEIPRCVAASKYTNYNSVASIVIPDEALNGEEIAMYN